MRVLLSTYGSRGGVAPRGGFAVRLRTLGEGFGTVAVAAERRDAPVEIGGVPTGVWL